MKGQTLGAAIKLAIFAVITVLATLVRQTEITIAIELPAGRD